MACLRRGVRACVVRLLLAAWLAASVAAAEAPVRSEHPATTNYSYEIWYEIKPGGGVSFDAYFEKLREVSARIPHSLPRWVDVDRSTGRRVVTLPVEQLGEYGSERYNELGLPLVLGDGPSRALIDAYADAQISRASYIRRYRADLSLNRAQHTRGGRAATEYTQISIAEGQERRFERLWKKALAGYAMTTPDAVLTLAQTVVGGGPQFLLMRPLPARDAARMEPPDRVVERAFGAAEGKDFARQWTRIVSSWKPAVFENAGLDSIPPALPAPSVK